MKLGGVRVGGVSWEGKRRENEIGAEPFQSNVRGQSNLPVVRLTSQNILATGKKRQRRGGKGTRARRGACNFHQSTARVVDGNVDGFASANA